MCIDGGNSEGCGRVLPLGGPEDIRDVRSTSQVGGMGVVIGGGVIGGGRAVAYKGIHLEATGYHCGLYCEPPNL